MRVLLVEDETAIAHFIAEGLEEEGFAVDVDGVVYFTARRAAADYSGGGFGG